MENNEEILKFIKKFFYATGNYPTVKHTCQKFNCTEHELREAITKLKKEGKVPFIKNEINKHSEEKQIIHSEKNKIQGPIKKITYRKYHINYVLLCVIIICLIISISSSIASFINTKAFFDDYFYQFLSVIFSLTSILFIVINPEIISCLGKHKIKWLFIFMQIIVTLLSMTTTVAELYNGSVERINSYNIETKINNKDILILKVLNEEKTQLEGSLKRLSEEYDYHRRELEKIDMKDSFFINASNRVTNRRKEINIKENELKEKNNEITKFIETRNITVKEISNFFTWLSGIIKIISPGMLQFIISSFLAILIDIIAPASLWAALYLFKKRKISNFNKNKT